jgi:hypothetical protein
VIGMTNTATNIRRDTWPTTAVTWMVGVFCVVVVAAVLTKPLRNADLNGTDVVILLACALRGLTVLMAQATIREWGRRIPAGILLAGLAGAAGLQVFYPTAEFAIKILATIGIVPHTGLGATHTDATSWFNFAMTVLIWGIPGALLGRIAIDHRARTQRSPLWAVAGIPAGIAFLFLLGLLIG